MDTRMETVQTPGRPLADVQITALIPTYNRAHLVPRALDSILNQTCPPHEIIIVDDGSTDNTREVVARFGDRVRYIYQENAGAAVARHQAVMAAQTEWVGFLDSDDLWKPDHLERISDAIIATGGRANLYFANTRRPQNDGGIMQWQLSNLSIKAPYEFLEDGSEWVLKKRLPMMLQATVFKRSAYIACGGFYAPLRSGQDTHLFLKLGLNQPVCAVAGGGAEMTDDDIAQNRLSTNFHRTSRGKALSILMYQELLDYFEGQLTPEQQDVLSLRLANNYLGVARTAWQERDFRRFAKYLLLSRRMHPRAIRNMFGRKLSSA